MLLHLGNPLPSAEAAFAKMSNVRLRKLSVAGTLQEMRGASTSRLSAFSEIGQSERELRMAVISYASNLNSSMAKMDAPTTL